jgi:hypothetical protein
LRYGRKIAGLEQAKGVLLPEGIHRFLQRIAFRRIFFSFLKIAAQKSIVVAVANPRDCHVIGALFQSSGKGILFPTGGIADPFPQAHGFAQRCVVFCQGSVYPA